jgi:hypothetical protein
MVSRASSKFKLRLTGLSRPVTGLAGGEDDASRQVESVAERVTKGNRVPLVAVQSHTFTKNSNIHVASWRKGIRLTELSFSVLLQISMGAHANPRVLQAI